MNLYNIFENKKTNEDFNGLMMGVQEDDPIGGALVDGSGVSATVGTDNDISPLTMTEQDEYGNPVTEHDTEVLDEVAMNPKVFAQAIEQGQSKGVLVGFEFETCIPKRSVEAWKTGSQETVAGYNPEDTSWIDGKTVADFIDGLNRVGRRNWETNFNDLFKYKASVKTATGFKNPWYHYSAWTDQKVAQARESADATAITFKALSEFLKDPEVARMEVSYMNNDVTATYGDPEQYNGKTFAIRVLKELTGVDFGKRVPKAQLTPELAQKVREACHDMYRWTRGPFDSRASAVGNAVDTYLNNIRSSYRPGHSYRFEVTDENIAAFKQHFSEFCREKMGTDNLKDLLKTKWAFNGRVNNTSDTLREKLWYYVTPGADEPVSLQSRSYNRGGYSEGAEFLKANLKDVFGQNMVIFTGYHQDTKKLDRWYIEPDGSLRPNNPSDYTAEVVSPPLKAAEAMTALRTWYQKAEQLKLYTNNSTGLHINVSIPDTLDVLKLAVFAGDQYVLKQFGREDNNYARSVIKSLKGKHDLPRVGDSSFKDAEKEMKQLVKSISGDHFATVNFNGKYVSFRHAGGDYLNKGQDIANTVGRFVRAMIIAADPKAYRDEYIGKLVKMMKGPVQSANDKLPLSDIRSIAQKGIPTVNLDVVVMPETSDMPTQSDIDNAVAAIKRWAGEDWKSPPSIVPDPSARARLLDSRGFASLTKDWMQRAPENMFYRVTIYPSNRRELESLTDGYTSFGTDRSPAIGLHYGGKRAVGVKYRELIKQDNPAFVGAIQALRGGASKPLPLPGSKAAPATQTATQQGAEKFGIWDGNGWVTNGNGRIEGSRDEVQDYMNQWNLADNPNYELRQIRTPGDTEPQSPQTGGYRVVMNNGTPIGRTFDTEEEALGLAQDLANARNQAFFVNDPEGNRVGGARPQEDDDEETVDSELVYHFVNADTGETLAVEDYASTSEAFENALELANNEGVTVEVRHGENETPLRRFRPESEDQQHTATGSYRLINNSGNLVANFVGSLEDAMNAAQHHANQTQMIVGVTLNGQILGSRRPERSTENRPDPGEPYYSVRDIGGRLMARGDVLRDLRVTAQALADREGTTMEIRSGADDDVIDTFQPRQQTSEGRIFHANQKVNVIYNPYNSAKKIIVAKAVDHAMANRVIDTYVHRTANDPSKMSLSAKDFILQPIEHYTNEGITSPGGMTTNDSTSPIHGMEEHEDEKIAGRYDPEDFDAMVARVGQKAREQEKRKPVDLAKLAQRLRQGEQEMDEHIVKTGDKYQLRSKHGNKNLGTYDTRAGAEKRERQVQYFKHMGEDEIMEAHLRAMKRAGYDIL